MNQHRLSVPPAITATICFGVLTWAGPLPAQDKPMADAPRPPAAASPIEVTEKVQASPSSIINLDNPEGKSKDSAIKISVPAKIRVAVGERLKIAPSTFDSPCYEAFTMTGERMPVHANGITSINAHIGTFGRKHDVVDYKFRFTPGIDEATPDGRRITGVISIESGAKSEPIQFDARIKLEKDPQPNFPKHMKPSEATIKWEWKPAAN